MFQILIVEDDKELSQLFQKVLEKNGYQVKSCLLYTSYVYCDGEINFIDVFGIFRFFYHSVRSH